MQEDLGVHYVGNDQKLRIGVLSRMEKMYRGNKTKGCIGVREFCNITDARGWAFVSC